MIAPLLKLLQYSCKLKQNRARMLHMDAARTLLRLACDALAQEALGKLTERLLLTAESLLEEELGAADARGVLTIREQSGVVGHHFLPLRRGRHWRYPEGSRFKDTLCEPL